MYANTGSPAELAELERNGVSVRGKIVIARYGGLFRGLKVKAAEQAGAKGALRYSRCETDVTGVLIYSDTADDGTITVENGYEAYPAGPARNPSSVQRGSAQALSQYPGDPLTPGWASHKDSKRIDRHDPDINIPSA